MICFPVTIHGEEYHVLSGAMNLIQEYSPIITLEIWDSRKRLDYKCDQTPEQTFHFLQNLGYHIEPLESQVYVAWRARASN